MFALHHFVNTVKLRSELKHIATYAFVFAALVFVLKWLQWKFLFAEQTYEWYIALIALFFAGLGAWIAGQVQQPKKQDTEVFDKRTDFAERAKQFSLSQREYEVLSLLAQGHRNAEIAEKLFISLSTVKTHVSNLLLKLEVDNRTQALNKTRSLGLLQ